MAIAVICAEILLDPILVHVRMAIKSDQMGERVLMLMSVWIEMVDVVIVVKTTKEVMNALVLLDGLCKMTEGPALTLMNADNERTDAAMVAKTLRVATPATALMDINWEVINSLAKIIMNAITSMEAAVILILENIK